MCVGTYGVCNEIHIVSRRQSIENAHQIGHRMIDVWQKSAQLWILIRRLITATQNDQCVACNRERLLSIHRSMASTHETHRKVFDWPS